LDPQKFGVAPPMRLNIA